jgi:hypothetical protein
MTKITQITRVLTLLSKNRFAVDFDLTDKINEAECFLHGWKQLYRSIHTVDGTLKLITIFITAILQTQYIKQSTCANRIT